MCDVTERDPDLTQISQKVKFDFLKECRRDLDAGLPRRCRSGFTTRDISVATRHRGAEIKGNGVWTSRSVPFASSSLVLFLRGYRWARRKGEGTEVSGGWIADWPESGTRPKIIFVPGNTPIAASTNPAVNHRGPVSNTRILFRGTSRSLLFSPVSDRARN